MASTTSLLCFLAISALFFATLSQDNHQAEASFETFVVENKGFNSQQTVVAPATAPSVHTAPLNCTSACAYRCSLHGRPKICIRACETCCYRCKCVPPGTSGNHLVCGTCYNNQFTHGGRSKCP